MGDLKKNFFSCCDSCTSASDRLSAANVDRIQVHMRSLFSYFKNTYGLVSPTRRFTHSTGQKVTGFNYIYRVFLTVKKIRCSIQVILSTTRAQIMWEKKSGHPILSVAHGEPLQ